MKALPGIALAISFVALDVALFGGWFVAMVTAGGAS